MSKYASPGRLRSGSASRAGVGVAAVALAAAACGSSGSTSAAASHAKSPMPEMSSSMPMPSPSMSMGGGMLPMGAKHMHVTITSPASGTKVIANSVTVHVRVTGYKDTCAMAGRPLMGGMEATATGHYHVLLDGSLINMFCTPTAVGVAAERRRHRARLGLRQQPQPQRRALARDGRAGLSRHPAGVHHRNVAIPQVKRDR